MAPLNIQDRRERLIVSVADVLLSPARLFRRRDRGVDAPARILCLRLERIGDLLMTLPALAQLRALVPSARIDLVVGSWNAEIARTIRGIASVESLDAAWLARGAGGASLPGLLRTARTWRGRRYDLVINFEPDVRSNLIAAAIGGKCRAGFSGGGGDALLDVALPFDTRSHTADNAVALVRATLGRAAEATAIASLDVPAAVRAEASRLLAGRPRPIVALHVSAGRIVKQWPEDRFAEVAAWLVRERGCTLVFTGDSGDRPQVDRVRSAVPNGSTVDLVGCDLLTAAAVLEQVDLLVAPDTGPMHLAHAVGTPVVAVFGPSDPARYGPRDARDRVVRVDLPCSPCNRIRVPPARCQGHTPDCLTSIPVSLVLSAIDDVLGPRSRRDVTASA